MEQAPIDKLIDKCKDGDAQAFGRLIEMYSGRCFGFFYRLTGNYQSSEDLLSDLFVKLVEKIKMFHGDCFDTWLFTVAGNLFKDHLRGQYRHKKMLESVSQNQPKIESRQDSAMLASDEIAELLGKLDSDTAQLITMRFYGQMGFKELAELRQEPIGTTLSKLHRGLKRLRELLE